MNLAARKELAAEKLLAAQLRRDIKRAEKNGSPSSAAAYRGLLARCLERQDQIRREAG